MISIRHTAVQNIGIHRFADPCTNIKRNIITWKMVDIAVHRNILDEPPYSA